jgi:chemotaxis protein methyltransferase CheR
MTKRIHIALLAEFAEFMAIQMGLSYPKERWLDLLKGLQSAAKEFGFDDPEDCIRWLMSSPLKKHQIETLACQFTVGETYFFREPRMFEALENHILPEIIQSRQGSDRRIRFWSAGSCTGEEAYSIAILISRMICDLANWNISILATDINPLFLQRATEGIYREWSFRGTPYWLKEKYFNTTSDGNYQIVPHIQKMVKFQYLNLVEDAYPSLFNDTNAMDFIFCRNVLMYFNQDHMAKAINRFHQCLLDKGWLIVGSSETSHVFFPQYTACNFPGAILYNKDLNGKKKFKDFVRKETPEFIAKEEAFLPFTKTHSYPRQGEKPVHSRTRPRHAPSKETSVDVETMHPFKTEVSEYEEAFTLYESGEYEAVITRIQQTPAKSSDSKIMTLLSKAYANQGKLNDAIVWCEKALSVEKLNPEFHHLRAVILQEQGRPGDAIESLKRALYLDSNFVLAHYMLGNLSQQAGKIRESAKYFENALSLLSGYGKDSVIKESDGMTAGRLKEHILLMLNREMNA